MLTTNEVLAAFDAIGDPSTRNQVLKQKLYQGEHSYEEIATAIEFAIQEGYLSMTSDGFISRAASFCIARFSLTRAGETYIAHGNSDGSWLVAENNGRMLAPPGSTHSTPMKIIKAGQSAAPERIAADLAEWARGCFGAGVIIESL
ncbi:hypothetical protein [Ralstonia pseudosolanacearum]|uniref:hypothetical protein n=1 Tax=Ralstonia pseudosolanacearum TaxID=1310165 RepID=UPI003CF775E4